jgi:hypothetical protein
MDARVSLAASRLAAGDYCKLCEGKEANASQAIMDGNNLTRSGAGTAKV